jgi:hypothetical protein
MRKLIRAGVTALAIFGAASLGGCITLDDLKTGISSALNFSITQEQVDAARLGYDTAFLAPAAAYTAPSRPLCLTGQTWLKNGCKQRSHVIALQAADKDVEKAFNDLQDALNRGDKLGIQATYTALKTAVDAAKGLIVAFKLTSLINS